jgi:hypothetical protein
VDYLFPDAGFQKSVSFSTGQMRETKIEYIPYPLWGDRGYDKHLLERK